MGARREPCIVDHHIDVNSQDSVGTAITKVYADNGCIDVVINNAEIASRGPMESFTVAELLHAFDMNTFGSLRINKAVLTGLRERKSRLIIQITSSLGGLTIPMVNAYGASKFAMESFAESFHYQLKLFSIDVAIVESGSCSTPVMDNALVGKESRILSAYNAGSNTKRQKTRQTLRGLLMR